LCHLQINESLKSHNQKNSQITILVPIYMRFNLKENMNLNSYLKLLVFLLALLVADHQSLPLRIKEKKTINNLNSWALEWFLKNKNKLISLTDQQLKFKLYQELVKYSKINQKIFNDILSKILAYQKRTRLLEQKIFQDNLYSIRLGK
jgi:hypothetical protein